MRKPTVKQKKDCLISLLEGYKKANELIMAEKGKRLVQMGVDASTCEYDHLCGLYSTSGKKRLGKLENQKILFLLKRREIFNKVGKTSQSR